MSTGSCWGMSLPSHTEASFSSMAGIGLGMGGVRDPHAWGAVVAWGPHGREAVYVDSEQLLKRPR